VARSVFVTVEDGEREGVNPGRTRRERQKKNKKEVKILATK